VTRSKLLVGVLAVCVIAGACSRSSSNKPATTAAPATTSAAGGATSSTTPNPCAGVTLQATDVGITPTDITLEVMADVGSPLAPGLFQGNLDAVSAFASYINANGGIACRQLKVRTWDSKLDPTESKNGLIDACSNAFAMVGNNALFNPDMSPATGCADKSGAATGLPDITALANDVNEECATKVEFNVQNVIPTCPVGTGVIPQTAQVGPTKWYIQQFGALHGIYMIPADLPTTIRSSLSQADAQQQGGVSWDAKVKVSGADAQPAYTPRVQAAKAANSNYVYDGSNDVAMIRMRKEAEAQGLTSVKLWACSLACYTQVFLQQGGTSVEGTYLWIQFLPYEEASYNAADQAFVTAIGNKITSWGANAWQAGMAFQEAVNAVVAKSGPNGVTRAAVLAALKGLNNFTADGWLGTVPKALQGPVQFSPCYMIMKVQGGKFVRVYPTKPGTLDCTPSNVTTINIDPIAEANALK